MSKTQNAIHNTPHTSRITHRVARFILSFALLMLVPEGYSQTAPIPKSLSIEKGAGITSNQTVALSIVAENAEQMFLSGNLVDDDKTLEWISYSPSIQVKLTEPDGTKQVSVRFRNGAQIESLSLTQSIILDRQGPVIQRVGVSDASDPQDVDGIFHAGERLQIAVTEAGSKNYFDGSVQIVSAASGYDSGLNQLTSAGGVYRFLWITDGFNEGEYRISVHLEDQLGRSASTDAFVVLDNTPPIAGTLRINNNAAYTNSRLATLDVSFPSGAVSLFVDGDVIDGPLTRQWISVRNRIGVTLTESNGVKEIRVRLRDAADNEGATTSSRITLNQRVLEILRLASFDNDQPTDADGIYHSGQQIAIEVQVADALEGLKSQLRFTSAKVGYDSGLQALTDEGGGRYRYIWNTQPGGSPLRESDDYQVTLRLSDGVGHARDDRSLVLTLDNTPPQNLRLSVVSGERTASPRIVLNTPADGASEMRIAGDVVDDANTFDWVAYQNPVSLVLLPGDGDKLIEVQLRDRADNVSIPQRVSVFLDTLPPQQLQVTPGVRLTNQRKLRLSLSAEGAEQMFVGGDIQPSDGTFRFIPFPRSLEVELTPSDGRKTVVARFRDTVGNESETSTEVTLDQTPPTIRSVVSRNRATPSDADGQYRPGTVIELVVTSPEAGLVGSVTIASDARGYSSGVQPLSDSGGGTYTFVWETVEKGITPDEPGPALSAGVYQVSVELVDAVGNITTDSKTRIVLDNTPPITGTLQINEGLLYTASRVVQLSLSFPADAVSVFIDGDLIDGLLIRQWVSVREQLSVPLTPSNGKKEVRARFRDAAENESPTTSSRITLNRRVPEILRLTSFDSDQPTDADGIYHSGQQIAIEVQVADVLEGLESQLRFTSAKVGYDSGLQTLTDEGGGRYRYVWNTQPQGDALPESDDYQVTLHLSDGVGNMKEDNALVLTLDNTPPQNLRLSVTGGTRTASGRVLLNLPAEGASEMRITGDIVDDANTFDWVTYTSTVSLYLLPGDGEKRIEVTLRDRAGNESAPAQVSVFLDTAPPLRPKLTPETALTNSTKLKVSLAAEEAEQIFVHGDVQPSDVTFQWIPFAGSPLPPGEGPGVRVEVELKPGDGRKTIIARFRDTVKNESEAQTEVTLDQTLPEVRSVRSRDVANPADTDGRYRPGRVIEIIITSSEAGLVGNLTVTSDETGYNTGTQTLLDAGGGTYTYVWESPPLAVVEKGGVVYQVSVELTDTAGNRVQDDSYTVTLTEDTILNEATLNDGALFTDARQVSLKVVAPGASEMFITGDVESTDKTGKWIPFTSPIELLLSRGDGRKSVRVQLRDNVVNNLGTVSATITLDQTPPVITNVEARLVSPQVTPPAARARYHAGEQISLVLSAVETGLNAVFRMRSNLTAYDSGEQGARDSGNGTYTFLWDTVGLQEADDYSVHAMVTDGIGHTASNDRLVLQIDNTPPQDARIEARALTPSAEIRIPTPSTAEGEGELRVKTRSIQITYSAEDATEAFIDGDIVADSKARVWLPIDKSPDRLIAEPSSTIIVNLTPGDGPKSIRVRFRDVALNETSFVSRTVVLDEQPSVIVSLILRDNVDGSIAAPQNDVFFFRAGQEIQAEVQTEAEATVLMRIRSDSQAYDTGEQPALPVEGRGGIFQYLWKTQGLKDSEDYTITAIVRDVFGRQTERNLKVVLDTVAPEGATIQLNGGQPVTGSNDVSLNLSAVKATEMFLSGDVVADNRTFQWIPFRERMQVTLTSGDGEKAIFVLYRDEARNETLPVSASITLDTIGPGSISIQVQGGGTVTQSRDITLTLEAKGAVEMFLDGNIVRDTNVNRWIPFAPEFPVKLTDQDGEKRIGVRFRSAEGNQTPRIETSIVLDRQPPVIGETRSSDTIDSSDNDGIYRPGQQIRVSAQSEAGATCTLRMTGAGYDSGAQDISDARGGVYQFVWNTQNLKPGGYSAHWECADVAGNLASQDAEIRLDDTAPTDGRVEIVDTVGVSLPQPPSPPTPLPEGEGSIGVVDSPSVRLRLHATGATEMFVSGDVVDDNNTFQWILYREELLVNLAGRDGEKRITARFRSAARVESQEVEVRVTIDTARPRLLAPVNLFESAPPGTSQTGREAGVVILNFDEDIRELNRKKFHLSFTNPFRPGHEVRLDAVNVKSEVNLGKLVLTLSPEQVASILALQEADPTRSVIQCSLAEDSVLDEVLKGNFPADAIRLAIARLTDLPDAVVENRAFSPNGDGVQDTVRLTYTLPANGQVSIGVRDIDGILSIPLRNEFQSAGVTNNLSWDGRDEKGKTLPDGGYQLSLSIFDTGIGLPIGLKSWNVILDNRPPDIVAVEPKDGQAIVGVFRVNVTARDGGVAPSGIAEVFLSGGTPAQRIPLLPPSPPDRSGQALPSSEALGEGERYELPSGVTLSLPLGENRLTIGARDQAGNETQVEATYFVSGAAFSLINYPNPVKSGAGMRLRYVLDRDAGEGTIRVFDAAGELVYFNKLERSQLNAGQEHKIEWDGQDIYGKPLPRGVYFALLQVEEPSGTRKVKHKIAVR